MIYKEYNIQKKSNSHSIYTMIVELQLEFAINLKYCLNVKGEEHEDGKVIKTSEMKNSKTEPGEFSLDGER